MDTTKLHGILPALMTAFDGDSLNKPAISALVRKLKDDGVDGLYVGGSSGEMVLCSTDERRELLETVMEVSDGLTVIAHVGAMSTAETVKLARHAKECGADAVSSVTPLYYKYTFEQVRHYYERIAEAAELPLIIYNIPALTGTSYGYEQLCELLELPGIGGMKFTSSDFFLLNRLVRTYPDKVFYNGSDEMLLSGLAAGAHGGIGTTYNFMPDVIMKIRQLFLENKITEAQEMQSLANRVIAAILRYGAVPASKQMISFYGVDYGCCREPFLPLTEDEKAFLYENAQKPLMAYRTK